MEIAFIGVLDISVIPQVDGVMEREPDSSEEEEEIVEMEEIPPLENHDNGYDSDSGSSVVEVDMNGEEIEIEQIDYSMLGTFLYEDDNLVLLDQDMSEEEEMSPHFEEEIMGYDRVIVERSENDEEGGEPRG